MTYTKCSRGVGRCTRSEGVFVNCPYTPMTAFVPSFTFRPAPHKPGPAPATATSTVSTTAPPPSRPQPSACAQSPETPQATSGDAQEVTARDRKLEEAGATACACALPLEPSVSPPSYDEVLAEIAARNYEDSRQAQVHFISFCDEKKIEYVRASLQYIE